MKLSELVHLYNQISIADTSVVEKDLGQQVDGLLHTLTTHPVQIPHFAEMLELKRQSIHSAINDFDLELDNVKKELKELIEIESRNWFIKSYKDYEDLTKNYKILTDYRPPREGKGYWNRTENQMKEFLKENHDQILSRDLGIPEKTKTFFESRVIRTSNWHYPAMIIHPGTENFVTHMVACDPLYLVDINHDLLVPALGRFDEYYRNRLRTYTIDENLEQPMLAKIPDNQLGVCLAYKFFNYRPFEVIKKYLEEIYQKLRPGGVLLMTFNDCDRYKAVDLAEKNIASFTPGGLIISVADLIGYELEFKYHDDGATTWVELKKPGVITSLRGGQTLAKIIPK